MPAQTSTVALDVNSGNLLRSWIYARGGFAVVIITSNARWR
jgi:hypothetical protein